MGGSRIAVVIPALNEARTIGGLVKAVSEYGTAVVVDDDSNDGTAEIAKRNGAIVVSHHLNQGYDRSLNSGFRQAAASGHEIIISMDADGQHDPELIPVFADLVEKKGFDMVIGIRDTQPRPAEYLFCLYTRLRFGIKDPLCGLKAYRTDIYRSYGCFDSYGSVGTELMLFAAKKSCKITQCPIPNRPRMDQPRFGRALAANAKILRALLLSVWRI